VPLDVPLSIATFVVAVVGVWAIVAGKIQRDQQWDYQWRNALLALGMECEINLALLGDASGYGMAAALRDAALQRALPFLSHLPPDLAREAVNVGVGTAVHGRLMILAAEDHARNPSPLSSQTAFMQYQHREQDIRQQVDALKASLRTVADGISEHVGQRPPVPR
jgi:hypothetical protein